MSNDILAVIQDNVAGFSKGQKLIANYILNYYDKAAFMTASKLGKTVNVSESTVVRFAAELGFDGYPSMQKALQEMIRNKLTSIQRIEVTNDRIGNQDILSTVMQSDVEKIRMTMEETDRTSFSNAVDAICNARKIYILGVRSASMLANFLAFYFQYIFEHVVNIDTVSISEVFEQTIHVGSEDVFIGMSFPRYSKRTITAMEYAKSQGATVIAITDSKKNMTVTVVSFGFKHGEALIAKSDMASFVDSLVAPLSLVNALIVAVSRKKGNELEVTLSKLEEIWAKYEVYDKPGNH